MKKLIISLIALFWVFSTAPCFAANKSAHFYVTGSEKYYAENYKGAIVDLNKAIQLNPKYIDAYFLRAKAEFDMGNNDAAAVRDFTKVIQSNPKKDMLLQCYMYRGLAKFTAEDYKGAIFDFTKSIQLDPNIMELYFSRANAELNMGNNNTAAVRDFTKVIQLNPDQETLFTAYMKRGQAKINLQDYKGAIEDENNAIKLNNKAGEAYEQIAIAKIFLNDKTSINELMQAKNLYAKQGNTKKVAILDSMINAHYNAYPDSKPSQQSSSSSQTYQQPVQYSNTQTTQTSTSYQSQSPTVDPYYAQIKANEDMTNRFLQDYQQNSQNFIRDINMMNLMQPLY